MQKVLSVLAEAEEVCRDVLKTVSVVKEKRVQVELTEVQQVVQELRRLHALLEEAVNEEVGEEEHVKEKAKSRDNKKRKEPSKSSEGASRPQREKRAPNKLRRAEEEEKDEGGLVPEKENPQRRRRRSRREVVVQEEDDEAMPVVLPLVKKSAAKKGVLKNYDMSHGPKGELVFYIGRQRTSIAECPVFGKEQDELFGKKVFLAASFSTNMLFTDRKTLVPCDFDALKEEEQTWACVQLCQVYADHIKRATGGMDIPLEGVARAHSTLQSGEGTMIFVNEHASKKGVNPDLLGAVRNAQRMLANAEVCRDSIYCMMAAKLHEELSGIVERGELTKQFREQLSDLCILYEMELKPSSLERYLPAGRMMLKCRALSFVNVSLLLAQQKVTERMLGDEEMMQKLSSLASGKRSLMLLDSVGLLDEDVPNQDSIAGTVAGLMKRLSSVATLDELSVTRVNSLSALDLARVLRMNFGNGPVGSLTQSIVWEYASLINTGLMDAGIGGWCLTENFRMDRVPPNLDWIAVACCDVHVGVLLNFIEKKVVACCYEPTEDDSLRGLVRTLAEKLNFPKKYRFELKVVDGYEDIGLLHWLSRIVWGKGQHSACPVELVRLQTAYELFKHGIVPQDQSFLSLIAQEQKPLEYQVGVGKELCVESLTKSGFCIIQGLLSKKLCGEDAVAELRQRVLKWKNRETIFQGPFRNDGCRVQASVNVMKNDCSFSEELQALLDATTKKLGKMILSRSPSHMLAVLSLEGCGPQRPHADYRRESLDGIRDDGFCGGMPLGVVLALQPNTHFDIWPGAIGWDESRFYEHKQLTLCPGDAVFFLGHAVHAGAAFEEENVRLHCYLDSPDVQREPDTTCFMDVAGGAGNVLPRVKAPS